MKKFYMTVIMIAGLGLSAMAQKGSILLYGNVGAQSTKDVTGDKTNSFSINLGVGYQFNNNWTAGINLGYNTAKDDGFKVNQFSAGPFLRYSKHAAGIFSLYGQLDANYVTGKYGGAKYNGVGANLFPAVYAEIKNGFGLNFNVGGLGFNTTKFKGAGESGNSFDFNFGQTLSIGLSKNF